MVQNDGKKLLECSVCYEDLTKVDIGELSSCDHRFCFPCINQWSESENTCPLCKQRFIVLKRKRLRELEIAALAAQAAANGGELPLMQLKGLVVETKVLEDRKQAWRPEDVLAINLDELRCEVCRRGDNDTQLLLCDGCDRGFHTYCCGLTGVPRGQWYCSACEEEREVLRQAAERAARTAARAQHAGRSTGPATRTATRNDPDVHTINLASSSDEDEWSGEDLSLVASEDDEQAEDEGVQGRRRVRRQEDSSSGLFGVESGTGDEDEGEEDEEVLGDDAFLSSGQEDGQVSEQGEEEEEEAEEAEAGPSSGRTASGAATRGTASRRRTAHRRRNCAQSAATITGRRRRKQCVRRRSTTAAAGNTRGRSTGPARQRKRRALVSDDDREAEEALLAGMASGRLATTARTRAMLSSLAGAEQAEEASIQAAAHRANGGTAARTAAGLASAGSSLMSQEEVPLSARRTAADARAFASQHSNDQAQVARLRNAWASLRAGADTFSAGPSSSSRPSTLPGGLLSGSLGPRAVAAAAPYGPDSAYVGAYGSGTAPSGTGQGSGQSRCISDARLRLIRMVHTQGRPAAASAAQPPTGAAAVDGPSRVPSADAWRVFDGQQGASSLSSAHLSATALVRAGVANHCPLGRPASTGHGPSSSTQAQAGFRGQLDSSSSGSAGFSLTALLQGMHAHRDKTDHASQAAWLAANQRIAAACLQPHTEVGGLNGYATAIPAAGAVGNSGTGSAVVGDAATAVQQGQTRLISLSNLQVPAPQPGKGLLASAVHAAHLGAPAASMLQQPETQDGHRTHAGDDGFRHVVASSASIPMASAPACSAGVMHVDLHHSPLQLRASQALECLACAVPIPRAFTRAMHEQAGPSRDSRDSSLRHQLESDCRRHEQGRLPREPRKESAPHAGDREDRSRCNDHECESRRDRDRNKRDDRDRDRGERKSRRDGKERKESKRHKEHKKSKKCREYRGQEERREHRESDATKHPHKRSSSGRIGDVVGEGQRSAKRQRHHGRPREDADPAQPVGGSSSLRPGSSSMVQAPGTSQAAEVSRPHWQVLIAGAGQAVTAQVVTEGGVTAHVSAAQATTPPPCTEPAAKPDAQRTRAHQGHVHQAQDGGVVDRGAREARRALMAAAAEAVKACLTPLYTSKSLGKDDFKAVAQAATHSLVGRVDHGGLTQAALLVWRIKASVRACVLGDVRDALRQAGKASLADSLPAS